MIFIRFNVHGKIRAFPFDENSFAFMARFITSRLHARYNCYSSGFIFLRFTCHNRKTWLLNVTRVLLRQDRIKGLFLETQITKSSPFRAFKEQFSIKIANFDRL